MKKLLPIILIITLLLVGCGSVSEETTPTTESAVATWDTFETSQTETMEATIPEPTEPREVWVYPAVLPKNGGYVFGCEIVNTLETTASVTSIIVVDTLDGNEVAVQEFVPGGVPHEMARGALTDLDPFGATVFHPVLKEDKINFDHRIITVNLGDTLGNTQTQEFRFTMDAGEATNSSFPDDEAWEPALYDGGYDAWRFYHSLVNYTDETLTLCGIYEVDYLDGVPINTWIPRGKDLEQKNIQVISTLVPGVAANLQNGITMEFATENQVKTIFVYQDSRGNYVPLTSRLILEQDAKKASWPVPQSRDGYWELTMELKNDTDGDLTVDAVYQINSAASTSPWQTRYLKDQLNQLGLPDAPLAPGETFNWQMRIDQAMQPWERTQYTVCLRDEEGNSSLQEFYFSFPQQPGASVPGSPEGYDMLLALGYVPLSSGYPQYTLGQIQEMIDSELTLDQVAEKISTIADLIQYLHLKGYQSDPRGDLKFNGNGTMWHVNRSAQTVFADNAGDCGGGSNLANYILRGDYDAQGYIQEAANEGGHIYNYFVKDGTYYVLDLTKFSMHGFAYLDTDGTTQIVDVIPAEDQITVHDSLADFSQAYIEGNHRLNSPAESHRILLQYAYPMDGSCQPDGSSGRTSLGKPFHGLLSEQIRDTVQLLYLEDEKYAPVFAEAPAKEFWPGEAQ